MFSPFESALLKIVRNTGIELEVLFYTHFQNCIFVPGSSGAGLRDQISTKVYSRKSSEFSCQNWCLLLEIIRTVIFFPPTFKLRVIWISDVSSLKSLSSILKISEWSVSSWCCNGVTQQCPLLVTKSLNIGCVPSFKNDNNCVAATRGVFKSGSGAGQPIQVLSPSRCGRDWLARSEVWNSNTFPIFGITLEASGQPVTYHPASVAELEQPPAILQSDERASLTDTTENRTVFITSVLCDWTRAEGRQKEVT